MNMNEQELEKAADSAVPTDRETLAALRASYEERMEIIRALIEENKALADENRALREVSKC